MERGLRWNNFEENFSLYSSEIKAQHDPERDNRMLQRVFRLEKCSPRHRPICEP